MYIENALGLLVFLTLTLFGMLLRAGVTLVISLSVARNVFLQNFQVT